MMRLRLERETEAYSLRILSFSLTETVRDIHIQSTSCGGTDPLDRVRIAIYFFESN